MPHRFGMTATPLLCVSMLTLGACGDSATPEGEASADAIGLASSRAHGPKTVDDEFADAARHEAPGFAGYYKREDGRLVIQVAGSAHAAAARQYAMARRARRTGAAEVPLVQLVRYDFAQLKGWEDQLLGAIAGMRGWQMDVDERANVVWVGAATPADVARIRGLAHGLRIPSDALAFEVKEPPEPRLTLRDRAPVVQGGFEIINDRSSTCSIGFNAVRNGQPIFVTASHCSYNAAFLDHRPVYQYSIITQSAKIGTEIMDLPYASDVGIFCAPYATTHCRWSDASYFGYLGGVPVDQGYIAWTSTSYTIDPSHPRVRITRRLLDSEAAVGDSMTKVGQNSGRTSGVITRRCVLLGGIMMMYCQYVSTIPSGPGDSGSPIFEYVPDEAHLHGLLWGGPPNDFNVTWYSPLSGIERDLGPISVCAVPSPTC